MTKINELLDLTDVDCSKIISEIEKNILIDRENGIIQDEISVDYLKNKINEISQMTSLDYIYPLFIAKGYTKKEAILSQGVDGFTNLTTMSRVFTIMFSAVVSNAKVY